MITHTSSRRAAALTAAIFSALILLVAVQSASASNGTGGAVAKVSGFNDPASSYSDNSVVVGFDSDTSANAGKASIATAGAGKVEAGGPRSAVVHVRSGHSLRAAADKLAGKPGVKYVKPNYLAKVSDNFVPNDPGAGSTPGGWEQLQWNFVGQYGINVLPAWSWLRDHGVEGGKGATVAVIDTGVAYENYGRYRQSPDLVGVSIRNPYDFLDNDHHANDRNGHGTHVASTIFETTNNGIGVTGIAYGATLMPLRALNSKGLGDEMTVARAIRYAANRGANVINLSVEFDVRLSARDLPGIVAAMRYARQKGTLVVAAAGNQEATKVSYPARSPYAMAVGASTINGCLADYSDRGKGIDIVAPGGGGDSSVLDLRPGSTDRANCKINNPDDPIYQVTFGRSVRNFSLPGDYQGTSMASPHVAATAALIDASGILGPKPKPAAVAARIQQTATDIGYPGFDTRYGAGIVNAGNAITEPVAAAAKKK